MPVEGTDHRRLHGVAPGRRGDLEVGGRDLAVDADRVRRPVRPVDLRHRIGMADAVRHLPPVGPDLGDLQARHVRQQHDVAETAGRQAADIRRQAHVAGRIEGQALDRDFGGQACGDGETGVMVAGAQAQGVGGAAVVGGEGHLGPVLQSAVQQPPHDLGHVEDAQLDEQAAGQLVPGLLRRLHLVVGGEPRGGEGVDGGEVDETRAMTLHHAPTGQGRLDHAPQPRVGRAVGVPHRRPVHHLVQTRHHQALGHEAGLLVAAVPAAAPLIGGRRHGRAGLAKDLHGRAAPTRLQPELQVARAVDVGELVTRLAGPGVAVRQDHGGLPLRGKVGALDVLVHLAEAGHGRQVGPVRPVRHLTAVTAGGAGPGDAAPLEDDLLVFEPGAAVHVQQPPDPESAVGGASAERGQGQVLADAHLGRSRDQQIISLVHACPATPRSGLP